MIQDKEKEINKISSSMKHNIQKHNIINYATIQDDSRKLSNKRKNEYFKSKFMA